MAPRGILTSYPSRLEALKGKYAIVNSRIKEAQSSPSTTDFYLQQLKRQRVLIKDEIEQIREASARG